MSLKKIKGVYTALVTPFNDDLTIDFESFYKLLDMQIEGNVDGVLIAGTTGEKATMNDKEYGELLEKAVKYASGKIKIMAGTGTNSTKVSIEHTQMASEIGADWALVVGPYYNKPTDQGYMDHFTQIADESKIPVVIYNVPGRTGSNIKASVTLELAKHPNIISIKEASGNLDQMTEILQNCPKDFSVMSGDDSLTLPLMALGGAGVISVVSNEVPSKMKLITDCMLEDKLSEAKEIHYKILNLMNVNFCESNPIPVKTALHLMGKIKENYRSPMCKISEQGREKVKKCLKELRII